jgi:hypothetical protein
MVCDCIKLEVVILKQRKRGNNDIIGPYPYLETKLFCQPLRPIFFAGTTAIGHLKMDCG